MGTEIKEKKLYKAIDFARGLTRTVEITHVEF